VKIERKINMKPNFLTQFEAHPKYLFGLSILSGILLSLSWYMPLIFLIFLGFVPILAYEKYIYDHRPNKGYRKLFLGLWFTFFLWNVGTTWWLWNASKPASIAAWLANGALQTLPVLFFHWTKRLSKDKFGYLPFLAFWLFFEYLHFNWSLSHPWLQVGNVFAFLPQVVQWYEYTGVLGGTLWVLSVNILIFYSLFYRYTWIGSALLFLIPTGISLGIYYTYEEEGKTSEVLVIQPNIDTYEEKYNYNARTGNDNSNPLTYDEQVERLFQLADENCSEKTQVVLMPETSLHQIIEESEVRTNYSFGMAKMFLEKHPHSALIAGVNSRIRYPNEAEAQTQSKTYRTYGGVFYDNYNSALFINNQLNTKFYHKSKLVIGVETNPFGWLFRVLDKVLMLNMGGMVGNLGVQAEPEIFSYSDSLAKSNLKVAPVICYESVYGEFVGKYIQKGATLIMIITNDDWWDDTAGHRQHFHYARLRAIEMRRSIARSANTGISGFINQRGDILQKSNYKEMTTLRHEVTLNDKLTVYAQQGNYLGKLGGFIAVFIFLSAFVKRKVSS